MRHAKGQKQNRLRVHQTGRVWGTTGEIETDWTFLQVRIHAKQAGSSNIKVSCSPHCVSAATKSLSESLGSTALHMRLHSSSQGFTV